MPPRCVRSRRCKATNQCVVANPPRPPLPGKLRFRCPTGKKQCPNRICYPSRLFSLAPGHATLRRHVLPALERRRKTRAATVLARHVRGRVGRQLAVTRRAQMAARERAATTMTRHARGQAARREAAARRAARDAAAAAAQAAAAAPRQPRQFYIAFGTDVSREIQAAVGDYTRLTAAQTARELAAIADKIRTDNFCVRPELSLADIKGHFYANRQNGLTLRLKPYSIFVLAKSGDQFVGFALIHPIQIPRELGRRERFDPATMFHPTGLSVDLICATQGGVDLIRNIHALGRRLFGARSIGVYLESIGSARRFYIEKAHFQPIPVTKMQSLKEAPDRYLNRDNYNMHLP